MGAHKKAKTAILISGRGSNMISLIEAATDPDYPAEISLVISNIADAAGLEKARTKGVSAMAIPHRDYSNRRSFEKALHKALSLANVEIICCAGFMRILSPWFVSRWAGRILNIHPSLLPKYKGLNTHQRALDAGDDLHGCTVHFVDEKLDSGDIILQDEISILTDDTAESLAARLLSRENTLYPKALRKIAETI